MTLIRDSRPLSKTRTKYHEILLACFVSVVLSGSSLFNVWLQTTLNQKHTNYSIRGRCKNNGSKVKLAFFIARNNPRRFKDFDASRLSDKIAQLPTETLAFGAFTVRFDPGGTFSVQGKGWPALSGNWKLSGSEVELTMSGGPGGCNDRGAIVFATPVRVWVLICLRRCRPRQMILDRSTWAPTSEAR